MTLEALFLTLLNRSLATGWLVLALLFLRPLMRRVSRTLCCSMWCLVAIRLLCPFSFQSVLSLIPSAQPVPMELAEPQVITLGEGIVAADFANTNPSNVESFLSSTQIFVHIAARIWLTGVLLFALYALISYLRLRRRVREAVRQEDGVWMSDWIQHPFILGVLRPRIMLPFAVEKCDLPYILAHERAHLARRDHWRKLIAFALLAVFWFQPFLWIAYFLLCRDIEFACDERALRSLGTELESKKLYAKALLRGNASRVSILACPLAFGGLQVKKRVKSVLMYKKPAMSVVLTVMILCGAVAVCFLTDPKGIAEEPVPGSNTHTGEYGETTNKPSADAPEKQPAQSPIKNGQEHLDSNIRRQIEDMSLSREEKDQFYTCLSHMRIRFLDDELPYMVEIENTGDADGSITFWVRYMVYGSNVLAWPDATEEDMFVDVKVITIPLPAGKKTLYTFDPGYVYTARQASLAGVSYADVSVADPDLLGDGWQSLHKKE